MNNSGYYIEGLIYACGLERCAHSHSHMKSLCNTVGFQGFQLWLDLEVAFVFVCVTEHV